MLAQSLTEPFQRAAALTAVARAAVSRREIDRVRVLADHIETAAESITDATLYSRAFWQAYSLTQAIPILIDIQDLERASAFTDRAETLARSITDPVHQSHALAHIAQALLPAQPERAQSIIANALRLRFTTAPALNEIVPALKKIAPTALIAAADELLSLHWHQHHGSY